MEAFSFVPPAAVEFFDEGSSSSAPLLTRGYDETLAFGVVQAMVTDARRALVGVPEEALRPMLRLADLLWQELIETGAVKIEGGPTEWTQESASRGIHCQALPLVLAALAADSFEIYDEDAGIKPMEVTPQRFCAAYILRHTFSSLDFGYCKGTDDLPICYLLQASVAHGFLLAMSDGEWFGMAGVLNEMFTRKTMSRLLDARHEENRQMVAEVFAWWDEHKNDPGMTKDKAADALAGKIVPLKWRTVRDHLKGV